MADPLGPQIQPQMGRKTSPTPSPPSLDTTDSELKLSRKREREVSLEPATTPSTEIDAISRDWKDSRTPAKKNRRHLDATLEEEDGGTQSRSNSVSPPLSVSPPGEMKIKVRQISQGVEDLSWRNMLPHHEEDQKDEEMAGDDNEEEATVAKDVELEFDEAAAGNGPSQGAAADQQDTFIGEATTQDDNDSTPPGTPPEDSQISKQSGMSQSQNMETATDGQGAALHVPPATTAAAGASGSRLRSDSESGEKGLKRKFLERGTSQGPPEVVGTTSEASGEALKRPRDDADRDVNPRENKRPSPPPEPKSPQRTSPPSPKVPKLGGFMAYASTSSPFASVKGKNLFASSKTPSTPSSFPSAAPSTPSLGFASKLGESSAQAAPVPKRTGFEAFASTSSPFASVARTRSPALGSALGPSSPPKRSGFEPFVSASSPFGSAAARAKSPVLGSTSKLGRAKSPPRRNNSFNSNPFGSYASAVHGFAIPAPKRARAGSPGGSSRSSLERNPMVSVFAESNDNTTDSGADDDDDERPATFGERLRAGRDDQEDKGEDEPKIALEEQELMTGEEDEETIMQVRGKLFALGEGSQWKERGTGIFKLNVKREDGSNPRLVMRKDAVYTLLLNATLFPGMRCSLAQDPRYLRFSIIEDGKATTYNLRVPNVKIAQELLEEINASIANIS